MIFNEIEFVFGQIKESARGGESNQWLGFNVYLKDVLVEAVVTSIRFDRVTLADGVAIEALIKKIEGLESGK